MKKDYYGNELIEGWYWYTTPQEPDVFYPCFFNSELNELLIDNKWYKTEKMSGAWLFKADMPIIN